VLREKRKLGIGYMLIHRIEMRHPNPLMFLRIAQGDAFGMSCEFRSQNLQEALRFERYIRHPEWGPNAGCYTDDTQMSIAVARCILAGTLTKEDFAHQFVLCYKRDPRPGYAQGFQNFLDSVWSGTEFLRKVDPTSTKNGAAMRSVPIGVLPSPSEVMHVAEIQASVTHDTYGGILSSQIVALASHYALYQEAPLSELRPWLEMVLDTTLLDWRGPVREPEIGLATARAVVTLLQEEKTLLDIARRCLIWGGDTDSVLAVAWGIASARMKEDLPKFFSEGLEDGPFGRSYLLNLGRILQQGRMVVFCR
jgi:ADP-ribosylglycohydrolase